MEAGTPLGDPIEVNALGEALKLRGFVNASLVLGSIKSCYGHTEGTAGMTGIFLACQALQHQNCPAVLNLRCVNPYVEAAMRDWHTPAAQGSVPRQSSPGCCMKSQIMAGSSSFGMGGTNAHATMTAVTPWICCSDWTAWLRSR